MFRLTSLAVALFALSLAAACSSPPEEPILYQFFTASRLGDTTSLENFATVAFDPRRDGMVNTFTITSVSPERTTPLTLKALGQTLDQARSDEAAFTKQKVAYQSANIEAIYRVLKSESAGAPIKGKDADVQTEWTKFRQQGAELTRRVSEARGKLASDSAVVSLSIASPGARIDPTKFDGEMTAKDVTVSASMKTPSGASAQKPLVVTMERAVLKGDKTITGRWIVTGVRDPAGPAGATTP